MKTQKIKYILILLIIVGCSTLKKTMIATSENLKDAAIHNAILDFSKKSNNLFTKDTVFRVSFRDSVFYDAILVRVDERTSAWQRGVLYDGIASVSISAYSLVYQFYYSEKTKSSLPSRHEIKNGKLFFWYDDNYPVTDEMIAILWKYNLLYDDPSFREFPTGPGYKTAHYYFCKNNLSKYKRVKTKRGLGFYDPPNVKCK